MTSPIRMLFYVVNRSLVRHPSVAFSSPGSLALRRRSTPARFVCSSNSASPRRIDDQQVRRRSSRPRRRRSPRSLADAARTPRCRLARQTAAAASARSATRPSCPPLATAFAKLVDGTRSVRVAATARLATPSRASDRTSAAGSNVVSAVANDQLSPSALLPRSSRPTQSRRCSLRSKSRAAGVTTAPRGTTSSLHAVRVVLPARPALTTLLVSTSSPSAAAAATLSLGASPPAKLGQHLAHDRVRRSARCAACVVPPLAMSVLNSHHAPAHRRGVALQQARASPCRRWIMITRSPRPAPEAIDRQHAARRRACGRRAIAAARPAASSPAATDA